MTRARLALGAAGEAAAALWYEQQGYVVVARNWRCREGELDLVVARRGELVFVEVKARAARLRDGVDVREVAEAEHVDGDAGRHVPRRA